MAINTIERQPLQRVTFKIKDIDPVQVRKFMNDQQVLAEISSDGTVSFEETSSMIRAILFRLENKGFVISATKGDHHV